MSDTTTDESPTDSSTLFPKADQIGETYKDDGVSRIGRVTIVAFDLNGERYCVECAKEMDSIDCERFHTEPRSVPAGGSVTMESMVAIDHDYHCGNAECGKKIPTYSDV